MFALHPCNGSAVQDPRFIEVLTKFEVNAYTRDKVFDPIVLYFYKRCDNKAPPGDDLCFVYCCVHGSLTYSKLL